MPTPAQLSSEVDDLMSKGLRRRTAVALVAERYRMDRAALDDIAWTSMLRHYGMTEVRPTDVLRAHG